MDSSAAFFIGVGLTAAVVAVLLIATAALVEAQKKYRLRHPKQQSPVVQSRPMWSEKRLYCEPAEEAAHEDSWDGR